MSIKSASPQRGTTLIEVLVALIVLSIGLLGMAGLQLRTLAETSSSSQRTIASQQAAALADMVRANLKAKGNFDLPSGSATAACFSSTGCDALQMAGTQVALWRGALGQFLPAGQGTICLDSTPDDGTPAAPQCDKADGAPYVIKVWWDDDKTGALRRFVTVVTP